VISQGFFILRRYKSIAAMPAVVTDYFIVLFGVLMYNKRMIDNNNENQPLTDVIIYTDGACSGNPGPGGWAAIISVKDIEKEISGFNPDTTNNRMEMSAALFALQTLNRSCRVDLYSDSAYLVSAFNEKWLENWQKRGWKNAAKMPVANKDLWVALLEEHGRHDITWHKVKGHSDNEYNNRCDKMAVNEILKNT
jgi:ribonuclease HI